MKPPSKNERANRRGIQPGISICLVPNLLASPPPTNKCSSLPLVSPAKQAILIQKAVRLIGCYNPFQISYFIKVSPDSKLKELQQELEASADWWTERTRTSPGSRFKDIVRTNMLASGVSKTKRNLKVAPFITANI